MVKLTVSENHRLYRSIAKRSILRRLQLGMSRQLMSQVYARIDYRPGRFPIFFIRDCQRVGRARALRVVSCIIAIFAAAIPLRTAATGARAQDYQAHVYLL